MTFAEADAQYEVIKQQYLAGALDEEQFDEQLHRLMVLDDAGVWWAKSRENGSWHYYDLGKGDLDCCHAARQHSRRASATGTAQRTCCRAKG